MALTVYSRGPIYWVRGSVRGRPIRRSLSTRNKEVAHHRAAQLELGIDDGLDPITMRELPQRFLGVYRGATLRHRRYMVRALVAALPRRNFLHEVTSLDLEAFVHRPSAKTGGARSPNSVRQEVSRLRRLFNWALKHHAIRENIALQLTMPAPRAAETLPFTPTEIAALSRAIDELGTEKSLAHTAIALRTRAIFEVLRCTGLRVSDLVKLTPEKIVDGRITLQTKKAGTPVRLKLLPAAATALAALPVRPSGYWFWTGRAYDSACNQVRLTFQALGRRAAVPKCHPHRMRDTFAVRLLEAGADIRLVSKLLGHSSIRVTEAHYAPWSSTFQRQAESFLEAAERAHQTVPKPKKKAAR